MTFTYCEAAIWRIMSPCAFRYIMQREPDWNIAELKRRCRQTYRRMISRTPGIGSMLKNPLRVCLTSGILWLSVYEAAQGRMNEELFEGMVDACMKAPLVKKSFCNKAKTAFTLRAQKKRAAVAAQANASSNPFQWQAQFIFGRDVNEYTILYRQCGLCALGRQEGLSHLVPYMCALDTLSIGWMGGRLYRTMTLASGGDCCDFYICRKDSEWDRERQSGPQAENGMADT